MKSYCNCKDKKYQSSEYTSTICQNSCKCYHIETYGIIATSYLLESYFTYRYSSVSMIELNKAIYNVTKRNKNQEFFIYKINKNHFTGYSLTTKYKDRFCSFLLREYFPGKNPYYASEVIYYMEHDFVKNNIIYYVDLASEKFEGKIDNLLLA